ncbi:glycoside hydrolase family 19 protein [Niabella hirudinis]|uniref:glycoside hydrolase family 19 protein n=1 Tax=Niabella hirudinis TaxID=1285929 RepID=UPI003EBF61A6
MGDIIFRAKKITETAKDVTWIAHEGDTQLSAKGFMRKNGDQGEQLLRGTPPAREPQETKEEKCFCEKVFTEEDIQSFYNINNLFSAKNCPLPGDEKNYKTLTEWLNKTMEQYDINTCLRKAHFLAQAEAETGFLTTVEYADGWDYDHTTHLDFYNKYQLFLKDKKKYAEYGTNAIRRGYNRYKECLAHGHNVKGYGPKYKGRGLIQLTWKDSYEEYFNYLKNPKLTDTPEVVANSLQYACDSAGWNWKIGSAWGDLNEYADNDDFISVCIGVNGGLNGFAHRKRNLKKILLLMKVARLCQKVKDKSIGSYKYETSKIRNTKYGKNHKSEIQKFDD